MSLGLQTYVNGYEATIGGALYSQIIPTVVTNLKPTEEDSDFSESYQRFSEATFEGTLEKIDYGMRYGTERSMVFYSKNSGWQYKSDATNKNGQRLDIRGNPSALASRSAVQAYESDIAFFRFFDPTSNTFSEPCNKMTVAEAASKQSFVEVRPDYYLNLHLTLPKEIQEETPKTYYLTSDAPQRNCPLRLRHTFSRTNYVAEDRPCHTDPTYTYTKSFKLDPDKKPVSVDLEAEYQTHTCYYNGVPKRGLHPCRYTRLFLEREIPLKDLLSKPAEEKNKFYFNTQQAFA